MTCRFCGSHLANSPSKSVFQPPSFPLSQMMMLGWLTSRITNSSTSFFPMSVPYLCCQPPSSSRTKSPRRIASLEKMLVRRVVRHPDSVHVHVLDQFDIHEADLRTCRSPGVRPERVAVDSFQNDLSSVDVNAVLGAQLHRPESELFTNQVDLARAPSQSGSPPGKDWESQASRSEDLRPGYQASPSGPRLSPAARKADQRATIQACGSAR